MFKFLKNIKFRFRMTYKDYLLLFVSINFGVLISIMLLTMGIRDMTNLMERRIRIFEIDRREQIFDLNELLTFTAKQTVINANGVIKSNKYIQELKNSLIKTIETMKKLKRVDLPNIKNIKEANLVIYNTVTGTGGSGTHIKINGNSYILTVAHIIENEDDILLARTNDGIFYPLVLEKLDKKKDLVLFRIKGVEKLSYLEIAKEAPKEGSEVIIIGNPANYEDMIADGVIAKITKTGYIFTNVIFFGNSGGAILYKGKIVGVVSQLRTYMNFGVVFVNYGYGCNLKAIQNFLRYIKPY